jgi:hypothetical protein
MKKKSVQAKKKAFFKPWNTRCSVTMAFPNTETRYSLHDMQLVTLPSLDENFRGCYNCWRFVNKFVFVLRLREGWLDLFRMHARMVSWLVSLNIG